jgi:Invasion associated locus B (IalB) protein.
MKEFARTVRRGTVVAIGTVIAASAVSLPASAGIHGKWESRETGGKCWAATTPVSSTGAASGRGPAYLSIQNHPSEGVRGSVAVVSGTKETAKGDVAVEVDGARFEMLPFDDAAFARSGAPEAALIAAMRKGREMTVTWTLPSGQRVIDRYSLDGFSAAKAAIDRNCQ